MPLGRRAPDAPSERYGVTLRQSRLREQSIQHMKSVYLLLEGCPGDL
ncbi:MAG TPA: hypothetical protein VGS23_06550 [Thermoplasmata archaeon]|nr:hypothetical protein [Thermoplasmata archaeon]